MTIQKFFLKLFSLLQRTELFNGFRIDSKFFVFFIEKYLKKGEHFGPILKLQALNYHNVGDDGHESLPKNANVLQLFQYIIKNFGPKYLYKGLEAKLLQAIVTAGFMFLTYEKISSLIFALSGLEKSIK